MFFNKIRFYLSIGLVVLHILLSGCNKNTTTIGTDQVFVSPDFSVVLEINSEQETHGSLMVINPGDTTFPATDEFNAEMVLWTSDGKPRARIKVNMIQSINPEETICLASGYWELDPGVYFLTWGAPEYGGNISIFSVVEDTGRAYLGNTMSFITKPPEYEVMAASAGSIRSFSVESDGTVIIRGETPVPDTNYVFPILFDSEGVVEGFPVGTSAQIAEGHWQITLPADPAGNRVQVEEDVDYQVILFSAELTLPPSEPFAVQISPPPGN